MFIYLLFILIPTLTLVKSTALSCPVSVAISYAVLFQIYFLTQ